jgi:hypothetical protein
VRPSVRIWQWLRMQSRLIRKPRERSARGPSRGLVSRESSRLYAEEIADQSPGSATLLGDRFGSDIMMV